MMGMLVDGKWTDEEVRNVDGRFERVESVFRNWITPDGAA
ncbi:MAG: glutathione S-transferase family protein, partial [Rhodospirillaceae bacterium]|nr:glutathione S-transferase family protein [Rhodospirillaceae bacterium]